MSLLRSILATEPDSRVTLVYGNRGSGSVIFRDALSDLKDRYLARLQIVHVFSREQQATTVAQRQDHGGQAAGARASSCIDVPSYDEVFVCGPEPMTLELRQALIDLGVAADRVHLELFGSHAPKPVATDAAGQRGVSAPRCGARRDPTPDQRSPRRDPPRRRQCRRARRTVLVHRRGLRDLPRADRRGHAWRWPSTTRCSRGSSTPASC